MFSFPARPGSSGTALHIADGIKTETARDSIEGRCARCAARNAGERRLEMDKKDVVSTLNDLIETSKDRREWFSYLCRGRQEHRD
jgi:hypothetical protein